MSSITKINNNIVIQSDRGTQPVTLSNWEDCMVSAGGTAVGSPVFLTFGKNRGFTFSSTVTDRDGVLETVNGLDVSAFTAPQIVELITSSVFTPDQFSGTPVTIDDTTQHTGQFTAIIFLENSVLDVTAVTGTIKVDGSGNAVDISGYSGITFTQGMRLYGIFTAVKLVSGSVDAISNL